MGLSKSSECASEPQILAAEEKYDQKELRSLYLQSIQNASKKYFAKPQFLRPAFGLVFNTKFVAIVLREFFVCHYPPFSTFTTLQYARLNDEELRAYNNGLLPITFVALFPHTISYSFNGIPYREMFIISDYDAIGCVVFLISAIVRLYRQAFIHAKLRIVTPFKA